MYLTSFLDSVILSMGYANLDLAKKTVQDFISVFGNEYKVINAEILPQGFDGHTINQKCVLVKFYPQIRIVNAFVFSEFGNYFETHKNTNIEYAKKYCDDYLTRNYPKLAPFNIVIQTQNGIEKTDKNSLLQDNQMLITFTPLINNKWD